MEKRFLWTESNSVSRIYNIKIGGIYINYLYQEIEKIRHRPKVYIGRISLTAFHDYLVGFQAAMHKFEKYNIEKLLPLPFYIFHEYVANHYNWNESTAGWRNIILKETCFDEEKAFWVFYDLFDGFKNLSIQSCLFAALSRENIKYHYTNELAPKNLLPPDYEIKEPLYIEPIEVYIIELTSEAGYLCIVNTKLQHRLECSLYKDKGEIEAYTKQCFGASLDWKRIEVDNIEFCKVLLI